MEHPAAARSEALFIGNRFKAHATTSRMVAAMAGRQRACLDHRLISAGGASFADTGTAARR